ncbi:MAG: hypothetical protein K6F76_08205 [Clostridiales bacterium]|nr:hypothetical protein [Clostridiales bacterium]
MIITFEVDDLSIGYETLPELVDDSVNYIRARFSFTGTMWEDAFEKTAIFKSDNNSYAITIDGDWCFVPTQVLREEQFKVGVMGSLRDDGVVSTFYTKECEVPTQMSCFSYEFDNAPPARSILERISEMQGQMLEIADSLDTKVDKVEGKGLSTVDFSYQDSAKLSSIAFGAQTNVVEGVSVNDVIQEPDNYKIVNINVPVNTSQLNNNSGFLTQSDLASVAISGDYRDLANVPPKTEVILYDDIDMGTFFLLLQKDTVICIKPLNCRVETETGLTVYIEDCELLLESLANGADTPENTQFVFEYINGGWTYSGNPVSLGQIGLEISGIPAENDSFTIVTTNEVAQVSVDTSSGFSAGDFCVVSFKSGSFPTQFSASNSITLKGDDVVNGVLVTRPNRKYQILFINNGNFISGTVTDDSDFCNGKKRFANISVAASAWTADNTFTDYPYRAAVTLNGVTSSDYANVFFSAADIEANDLSPYTDTADDVIYIFAADIPSAAITIPLIEVVRV